MKKLILGFLMLSTSLAWADRDVLIEATGEGIQIPEDWRPIPRAEIEEVETMLRARGETRPPMIAAFQRLPTLQWFGLPHLMIRLNPDCIRPTLSLPWQELASGLSVVSQDGIVKRFIAYRQTAVACYDLEYLTRASEEEVFLRMVTSLGGKLSP